MIFIGLGNPGKEYEQTRHNVGYMVVDKLVNRLNGSKWKKERGVAWSKIGDHLVVKPQEFMNLSGASIKSFLTYKHLDAEQLLVVHDDVDFPLGEIHEQLNRSAGGHNGVQSIIDALGTQNFRRLRIGIGSNREVNLPAEVYVLQKFTDDENKVMDTAVDRAVELLSQTISG